MVKESYLFPTLQQKIQNTLENNTLFYQNLEFEEKHESVVNAFSQLLLEIRNRVITEGPNKKIFTALLCDKELGLECVLTLIGLSRETFMRIITLFQIINDKELNKILNRAEWKIPAKFKNELSIENIKKQLKNNKKIAEGIINLLFNGASIPIIAKTLPLFELKKLDITKANFSVESLIDTIIRYKLKGSYSASDERNPETIIKKILIDKKIDYDAGAIKGIPRKLDFIIPNKSNPKIIIEVSYQTTTSSAQGDKAKTEGLVKTSISKQFPDCHFIGFVDGIGWYVRSGALKIMLSSLKDSFTFKNNELIRFEKFLDSVMGKNDEK